MGRARPLSERLAAAEALYVSGYALTYSVRSQGLGMPSWYRHTTDQEIARLAVLHLAGLETSPRCDCGHAKARNVERCSSCRRALSVRATNRRLMDVCPGCRRNKRNDRPFCGKCITATRTVCCKTPTRQHEHCGPRTRPYRDSDVTYCGALIGPEHTSQTISAQGRCRACAARFEKRGIHVLEPARRSQRTA